MQRVVCQRCGCTEYNTVVKGVHTGAYCAQCGKWIKWLAQKETHGVAKCSSVVNNTTAHGYTISSVSVPQVVKGTERMKMTLSRSGELSIQLDGTTIPVSQVQSNTAPTVVITVGEQRIELPLGESLDVYVM